MSETVERALSVVTTALVAVVAVFALLIVAGKPFGVHAYAVLSGSMEPEYSTGSLIYVKEVPASQLGEGDVITFMVGKDATVTHRIVGAEAGEDGVTRFRTQGDANSTPDGELVHPDNVIGTPVIEIPFLGYIVNFIQFPPGTYIAISVGAIAVFLMFLPDLFPSRKEEVEDEDGEPSRGRHAAGGAQGQYQYPQNGGGYARAAVHPQGPGLGSHAYGRPAGARAYDQGAVSACRQATAYENPQANPISYRQPVFNGYPQAGASYSQGRQMNGVPYGTNQVHSYVGSAPVGRTSAGYAQHPTYANPPASGDSVRQDRTGGRAPMPQGMHGRQVPRHPQVSNPQVRQASAPPNATRLAADPRLGGGQAASPVRNAPETHQPQARPARRRLP